MGQNNEKGMHFACASLDESMGLLAFWGLLTLLTVINPNYFLITFLPLMMTTPL